jgi:hypothetical protein
VLLLNKKKPVIAGRQCYAYTVKKGAKKAQNRTKVLKVEAQTTLQKTAKTTKWPVLPQVSAASSTFTKKA